MNSSAQAAVDAPPAHAGLNPLWHKLPLFLIGLGGLGGLIGAFTNKEQFANSYLLAFTFFLSLCLGGLFLTILHHLFDAQWSVPTRRVTEHMAFLLPVMALLFIPIAILAKTIYPWMQTTPEADHALHAKQPIFTPTGFYLVAVLVFAIWGWLSWRLRYWSIQQDHAKAGGSTEGKMVFPEHLIVAVSNFLGNPAEKNLPVLCTRMMRNHAGYGVYLFALTLTLGIIMWVKAIEHQWFSTMYGVYYFAGSVWTTLATLYVIIAVLKRTGPLAQVAQKKTFHDIGVLMFAFTVFYAYIAFSQYFLIWNANIPEETFWYVKREVGSWKQIGMLLIFGHFLFPFLSLLRIDAKLNLSLMVPLAAWAWVMHFCDMSFNIMPAVVRKDGFSITFVDVACMAFFGGVLSFVFLKYFNAHSPYPKNDPRLGEALGVHHHAPPDGKNGH